MTPLRVILIDDNDDVREAMEQILKHHMPDVVEVRSYHPDDYDEIDWDGCEVAIVDLMMPGRDGETILTELRRDHPGVYRLAWSGKDAPALAALARTGLAHAAIAKPGFDEVITKLRLLPDG